MKSSSGVDPASQSERRYGHCRYSATNSPMVTEVKKTARIGNPDVDQLSTSCVERQNLTVRMSMRRLTRLTNGFSKKLENLKAAVAVHFAHYNFVRKHQTIKTTPTVAAGVGTRKWDLSELVRLAG